MNGALDFLDSRALRVPDCYGQRFMKPGSYPYSVLPIGGHCVTLDKPFQVQVKDSGPSAKMKQHTVDITFQKGEFAVEPRELVISPCDLVLWHCSDTKAGPFVVAGDKEFFASNKLFNESGYSHAFGHAGEYRWVDAHGSRLAGIIRVQDPGCKEYADFQRWQKSLSKGALVVVSDTKAEPTEVQIFTGQTVFFAITKSPGISITDARLLGRRLPGTKEQPTRS